MWCVEGKVGFDRGGGEMDEKKNLVKMPICRYIDGIGG